MRRVGAFLLWVPVKLGPLTTATLVLLSMKLSGLTDLPWLWVLAPSIFLVASLGFVLVSGGVLIIITAILSRLGADMLLHNLHGNVTILNIWINQRVKSMREKERELRQAWSHPTHKDTE